MLNLKFKNALFVWTHPVGAYTLILGMNVLKMFFENLTVTELKPLLHFKTRCNLKHVKPFCLTKLWRGFVKL